MNKFERNIDPKDAMQIGNQDERLFNIFFNKKINDLKKIAKKDTIEEYLKKYFRKSLEEYKKFQRKMYTCKSCHSFWRRECENRESKLCDICNKNYSYLEWDKMTKEEQNHIKNS